MRTLKNSKASEIFYGAVKKDKSIDLLIKEVKKGDLDSSTKYAYQAFCCAILAKESTSYLQKGKYIKQYGQFITKSLENNSNSIEGRLVRLLIEQNLENVKFVSHTKEDTEFLKANVNNVEDSNIKELINNTVK